MSKREWFRAKIRWGVMVEGREGLRCWEESIHIFASKNHATIFFREKWEQAQKEKKRAKRKKGRPVETGAVDGNPQRTRIPTAA
jgi:hypothetical protein